MSDDLDRVTKRLRPAIMAFLRERKAGENFTAAELLLYVRKRDPQCAPGSPCRALRALRAKGAARVTCPDKPSGVYVVVEPPPEPAWRRCQRDGHVYDHETDHACVRCAESRGGYGTVLFSGERFE